MQKSKSTKVKMATWSKSIVSQRLHGSGRFWFLAQVMDRATKALTSSYDMALTRIRACMADDMACLCIADVDRMTSACHHQEFSTHGRHVTTSIDAWWHNRNLGSKWRRVLGRMRVRLSSYVDWRTTRPSWWHLCPKDDLGVKNMWQCVELMLEYWLARGGMCKFLWRPASWVLVTRGRGAHLCGWFHQVKSWFAQIW